MAKRANSFANSEASDFGAGCKGLVVPKPKCLETASIDFSLAPTWRKFSSSSKLSRARNSSKLGALVSSPFFGFVISVIICLNAVFLGLQVDYYARNDGSTLPQSMVVEAVFCAIFTIEVALKMAAERSRFFHSADKFLNMIDLGVVGLSLFNIILGLFEVQRRVSGFGLLRILRFLRYVRIMRTLRVLRFFRELRVMLLSVVGAIRTVSWAFLGLGLLTYAYGMVITSVVASYRFEDGNDRADAKLDQLYGSLGDSMFTLLQACLGGMDWGDAVTPLRKISLVYMVTTVVYVSFVMLAIMNMVTAIFCEQTIQILSKEKYFRMGEETAKRMSFERDLRSIFTECDVDSNDELTREELEASLQNEEVQTIFRVLGIEVVEAHSIFSLLDVANKGVLRIDEFVTGCYHIKQLASGIDLKTLLRENKRMFRALLSEMEKLERQLIQTLSFPREDAVEDAASFAL